MNPRTMTAEQIRLAGLEVLVRELGVVEWCVSCGSSRPGRVIIRWRVTTGLGSATLRCWPTSFGSDKEPPDGDDRPPVDPDPFGGRG
jgi:hypothetical protein